MKPSTTVMYQLKFSCNNKNNHLVALCSCKQWGCYQTTETIASVKHIDHLNTVINANNNTQPSQENT